MNKYMVRVITTYPATTIEEVVEIEAVSPEAASEYVLNGDGYLLNENIDYGAPDTEEVMEVKIL